ncbi:hypothetical protein [Candidatus Uabimicrobium amorphum]|uniref:Uncharacterized protein n=1 Tax=Uabimicrobium amorphum TaxID=2596890 RepID=A0A5S9IKA8_UABAM|nr:hypothetical protein [Candidatus Uabimicrobium amorphum]BBM82620.1 hypothetical protein UABAM_00963 [Candidatus Uabimicrobium amorphum]
MNGFNMDDKNPHETDKIKIFDNDNKSDFPLPDSPKDESVTIKGQNFIKISHSKERLFNIIDSTSEEEGDIIWRPEEKEVENHLFSPTDDGLGKTQRRKVPTRGSRSSSTRRMSKNKVKRKYPLHYYIGFYGSIIFVILLLGLLVILRYRSIQNNNNNNNDNTTEKSSEAKLWTNAEKKVSKAYVNINYAKERLRKQDKNNALIYFRKSAVLYDNAIKMAKRSIDMQITLEKTKRGFTQKQAEKYVNKEYKYYIDKIKKWESNLEKVTDEIIRIKAE